MTILFHYDGGNVQDDHLEIFRLAVDSNHRKAGVARALVNKIQSVGEILNLNKIKAETSSTFHSAVAFYQRNNWTEVNISSSN